MRKNFKEIKDALEEHLSAMNENTTEIQSMFDYLQEMEIKIDKFSHRLDNMQLNLGQPVEKTSVEPLDKIEKSVFLLLYTVRI